ncbi:HNH endonuclease [Mycolicibacterium porcinum]|uniref:HNH endonuclease signature motif containing protein n=1 Tax=Mycolicibacterium porcinum TaxID=39693 RepID=A0ABV3VLZ8_9MYCO
MRKAVHHRDNGTCQLRYAGCTREGTEVDHIIGVAELGIDRADSYDDLDNLQLACVPCHKKKTATQAMAGRQRQRAAARQPRERWPWQT